MAEYRIVHQNLTLTADPVDCLYTVTLPNRDIWCMSDRPFIRFSGGKSVPFPAPAKDEAFHNGTSDGVRAFYEGFEGSSIKLETTVRIERSSGDLFFEVRVEGDRPGEIAVVSFPAPFDAHSDGYTVLSLKQGALIPYGSGYVFEDQPLQKDSSYLPFYGQVLGGTPFVPGSSGYTAIYDTSFDALYTFREDRVSPLWRTSLGEMRYARRMLYRFRENCDYNGIAACYRSYVKEQGRFVTLREKAARNPNVERLFGCPVIHAGIAVHISPESSYYNKEHPERNDYYTSFDAQAERLKN